MAGVGISKVPVWASPLAPIQPVYAVKHGAQANTVQIFQALSQTTSNMTFQIQVPSLTTYIDRTLQLQSTVSIQINCVVPNGFAATTNPQEQYAALVPGQNFSLAAYPLHSLISNLQLSVNDAQVSSNLAQFFQIWLRLHDSALGRQRKSTPSKLDFFAMAPEGSSYNIPLKLYGTSGATPPTALTGQAGNPASGTGQIYGNGTGVGATTQTNPCNPLFTHCVASPYGGVDMTPYGQEPPNGAWPIRWLTTDGTDFVYKTVTNVGTNGTPSSVQVVLIGNGLYYAGSAVADNATWAVVAQFTVSEPLQISPCAVGGEAGEPESGFYAITNFQITAQMQSPDVGRIIRFTTAPASGANASADDIPYTKISSVQYASGASVSAFTNTQIIAHFYTPPIDLPLPEYTSLPLQNWVNYPYQLGGAGMAASDINFKFGGVTSQAIPSNVVNFNQIPDLIVLSAEPTKTGTSSVYSATAGTPAVTYFDSYQTGFYNFPITALSVTFNNISGLFSNWTAYDLWLMNKRNGIDVPYLQYIGYALSNNNLGVYRGAGDSLVTNYNPFVTYPTGASRYSQLTSVPLVLALGIDIPLFPGLAPGVQGSYSFSAIVTINNTTPTVQYPVVNVIAISSGYMTTQNGKTGISLAPISSTDVLDTGGIAPDAAPLTVSDTMKKVGGGFRSHLANSLSRSGARRALMMRTMGYGKASAGGEPESMASGSGKRGRGMTSGGSDILDRYRD